MSFTWPTKDQLKSRLKSVWQSYRPSADFTPYSDGWLYQNVVGDAWYRVHQTVQRALDALFPSTTYGVYLDFWLKWVGASDGQGGYGRILARGSTGTDVLQVVGDAGSALAIGDQLTDTQNQVYQINEAYVWTADGSVNVDVAAVTAAKSTNLEAGSVLTFVSPPAGVDSTATLIGDLDNGCDRETDPEGRLRLLLELQTPSQTGNWRDWETTIEAVAPGAIKAYVWTEREGAPFGWGRTDFCALQTNEYGANRHIAEDSELWNLIAAAVEERMPGRAMLSSRQLTILSIPLDVAVVVELSDGVVPSDLCDWDAYLFLEQVYDVDETLKRIRPGDPTVGHDNSCFWTTTNTGGLNVGHKIILNGAVGVVSALDYTNDIITVEDWPLAWGTATDWEVGGDYYGNYIQSGGGLIGQIYGLTWTPEPSGILGAIFTLVNNLGPGKGVYCAPITGWHGSITPLMIQSSVIVVGAGKVADVTVSTPAVEVVPTDDLSSQIGRLIPGNFIVWENKGSP